MKVVVCDVGPRDGLQNEGTHLEPAVRAELVNRLASAAEAMGGIRYINGFPGELPPRLHISLGDSLAGMYAVQGILAALYRRDALGGAGQVVDVSLLESCFSLLESAVPEYDRLGIVRGPGGTGLQGVAPSNVFESADGKLIVIAANADNVFRRLAAEIDRLLNEAGVICGPIYTVADIFEDPQFQAREMLL